MQKLGNVSSADAIGFLIETQMSAALARLEPVLRVSHVAPETPQPVANSNKPQHSQQQSVARNHQPPQPSAVSHTTPHDDATNALEALLSA